MGIHGKIRESGWYRLLIFYETAKSFNLNSIAEGSYIVVIGIPLLMKATLPSVDLQGGSRIEFTVAYTPVKILLFSSLTAGIVSEVIDRNYKKFLYPPTGGSIR